MNGRGGWKGGWKEGEAPRLLLSTEIHRDNDCPVLYLEARVVKVFEEIGITRVRNILREEPYFGLRLADLAARVYICDDVDSGRPYGMGILYRNVYAVDYVDARGMAETFKKIRRRMDATTAEVGPPETAEGYFTRVMLAINADGAIRQVGENKAWNYDSGLYAKMRAEDFRFHVREIVRKFKEEEKSK